MTVAHVNQHWRSLGPFDYIKQDHPGGSTVRTLRFRYRRTTIDVVLDRG